MVDSHLMQYGSVQIMDFDRIIDGIFTDLIGRSVNMAAAETTSRQPDTKTVPMMTATVFCLRDEVFDQTP